MELVAQVLVVDDNAQTLPLSRAMFRRYGYNAWLGRSSEEAPPKVINDPPDLIIFDVRLSGLNGIEVRQCVKYEEETRLIPIVIMTALHHPADTMGGIEAGADVFLTKSVDQEELMARVRTARKVKRTIDHKVRTLSHAKEYLATFLPVAVRQLVAAYSGAPELTKQGRDVPVLCLDVTGYAHLSQ